jgi:hypothetical protein
LSSGTYKQALTSLKKLITMACRIKNEKLRKIFFDSRERINLRETVNGVKIGVYK